MIRFRRLFSFLLCAALLLSLAPAAFADDGAGMFRLRLKVEGKETESAVRAYDMSYPYNSYISLSDLSAALSGTSANFRLRYSYSESEGSVFNLTTGEDSPTAPAPALTEPSRAQPMELSLRRHRLFVDGREKRYYSAMVNQDLFMSLADVQLILNLSLDFPEPGLLAVRPDEPFAPDLLALQAEGYFDVFNGVLLADAESGEVLFSSSASRAAPIASLSKLMSYLIIAEALDAGEVKRSDRVAISKKAELLSKSSDGMVELYTGSKVPFTELLQAMLLASSNECCLALAEHVAGSEEAFVARMNQRAMELGLRSARFYTPHGLPAYPESSLTAKLQNLMSPADLFKLSAYLLEHYPEITEITSLQYCSMPTLDYTTANSNPMVFNIDGVNGLKTGSTNRAGYCLVASLPVKGADGAGHTLVMVLLGAELAEVRGQASEILLRWGRDHYTAEQSGEDAA